MNKSKICLATNHQFGISIIDQIKLFKKVGFDGFFTMYDEHVLEYAKVAREIGITYHSIHAPFGQVDKMWKSEEDAKEVINELIKCIKAAKEAGVKKVICHAYIGFEPSKGPSIEGINNFKKVIDIAKELDINIAFENTEGEEYLDALLKTFKSYKNVGFCLDTGHQLCYNRGKDLMSLYGEQIMYVHINDNLGIKDENGVITWKDDLHLLPFDGIVDFNKVISDLNKYNYDDYLVLELNIESKPGRNENDKYKKMPLEEYLEEVYKRAICLVEIRTNQKPVLHQIHNFDKELFPITITEHQDIWEEWFVSESEAIKKLIEGIEFYRISHVGSTSIKNVKSKPIIDILIEIPFNHQFREIGNVLLNNGYMMMYDLPTRLILNKGYTSKGYEEKVFHVHIVYQGDNSILYFRDYLNEYPEVAKEYEKLKLGLSEEYRFNHDAYTMAKGEFVAKYTKIAKEKYKNKYE